MVYEQPGPIIFAPLSEVYGRKWPTLAPLFVSACFAAATATAENIQTIMITRFFAGVFASAPVTNVGGGLADMWDQRQRATAVVFYSLAVVAGPNLGVRRLLAFLVWTRPIAYTHVHSAHRRSSFFAVAPGLEMDRILHCYPDLLRISPRPTLFPRNFRACHLERQSSQSTMENWKMGGKPLKSVG